MYFLRFLLTIFVCCWCSILISSTPLQSSDVQKINDELLDKNDTEILFAMLVAASTGKNLFKMPASLNEDCIRTATATKNLFSKPSMFRNIIPVVDNSMAKVLEDPQLKNTSSNLMEPLCGFLNEEVKNNNVSELFNFEEIKKNVKLPKPAKDYYIEIQAEKSIREMLTDSADQMNDPEFLKFFTTMLLAISLQPQVKVEDAEFVGISKAILQLSEQEAFKSTIDSAFDKILEDYIKGLFSQNIDVAKKFADIEQNSFLKKLDTDFLENSTVKVEYEKIKKETTDQVGKLTN